MPVSDVDVGRVVRILARHRRRASYGAIGAALSRRAGNPDARPGNFGMATGGLVNAAFGGRGPVACWAVAAADGRPTGYGPPPSPLYDPAWSDSTPLHDDPDGLLRWLDGAVPGWDADLESTFP